MGVELGLDPGHVVSQHRSGAQNRLCVQYLCTVHVYICTVITCSPVPGHVIARHAGLLQLTCSQDVSHGDLVTSKISENTE